MELLKILFNTCRTIIILILLPNHNTKLQKNITRIRIIITLRQTILLYLNTLNINQHITIIINNNITTKKNEIYRHYITIDYISTCLLLLTTILISCCILISKTTIYHSNKKLLICLLITTLILFLAFTTINLLIFYILFWKINYPAYNNNRNMRISKRKNSGRILLSNLHNNRIITIILNYTNYQKPT